MKKILSVLICFALIFSLSITAFAASATLNGVPSELKKDSTATITVSVSGSPTASSALVQVTLGSGLQLVSGQWKKSGIMQDFNASNGEGVIALSSAGSFDGAVFSFVVKGKTVSSTAQSVTVKLTFKNGSSEVGTASVTKSIKVVCTSHTYGAYSKKDASNHTRTCSVCQSVETKAHTWNSGTVTKNASCKEAGSKTLTCTACNATKTETIAKTSNHTYGAWTQTKAPTCTAKGSESRTCSTCKKVETRDVKALGHKMSAPTVTKQATCKEEGSQEGVCSVCNTKSVQAIPKLEHKLGEYTVTKEATQTETGLKKATCTVCGEVKEEVIPALSAPATPTPEATLEATPEVTVEPTVAPTPVESEQKQATGIDWYWLLIVGIVAFGAGIATGFVLKNKKSN
ncbi:MAG: hypothetical protein E7365_06330 [Clostridiales bacterium]|nr:hypothetical protein [Clostridiales bacterium]